VPASQAPIQSHRKITTPSKVEKTSKTSPDSRADKQMADDRNAPSGKDESPECKDDVDDDEKKIEASTSKKGDESSHTKDNDGKSAKAVDGEVNDPSEGTKKEWPREKENRQFKAISGYIQKQMKARAKKAQEIMEQEAQEKAKKEKMEAAIKKKRMEASIQRVTKHCKFYS